MKKSNVTECINNCIVCGGFMVEEFHHLVYGVSNRRLSDEDGLIIPICRSCHDSIHRNSVSGNLSKMFGQAIFERNECAKGSSIEDARKLFRKRYGRSYL